MCHVDAMPTLWVSIAAYNASHPKLQVRLSGGQATLQTYNMPTHVRLHWLSCVALWNDHGLCT